MVHLHARQPTGLVVTIVASDTTEIDSTASGRGCDEIDARCLQRRHWYDRDDSGRPSDQVCRGYLVQYIVEYGVEAPSYRQIELSRSPHVECSYVRKIRQSVKRISSVVHGHLNHKFMFITFRKDWQRRYE